MRFKSALAGLAAAAVIVGTPVAPAAAHTPHPGDSAAVTNLDHLDFLLDDVPLLPGVPGHTTYQAAQQPTAEAPWVYANRNQDGSFTRVGGGTFDPATGDYGQGAFDADDIARSAVVYLRDWRQTGASSSRQHAYQLLRDLTYLQTSSGPNAGNVVLWQQSDGTLNPSPTPPDSPNPSDSAESFWLARTIWALGEGYPAFRSNDPKFARFLHRRFDLALTALKRGSLAQYGHWDVANGARVPAWIVTGSTAATAETVLGLSAAATADPANRTVRRALAEEAAGLAAMATGRPGVWPFGGFLASTNSRSMWNGWGGEAPAALSDAALVLHRRDYQHIAERAVRNFIPQVLTTGGPDNGWTPTPFDRTQIAYGADSLVESIVAVADNTGDRDLYPLAGIAAGWFFGANRTNAAVYDPATGVCVDGIAADGTVNRNCGAESTIHTQLTMLALDAHPRIRTIATGSTSITSQHGLTVAEAENGTLQGPATVRTPTSAWTGSANWSGSYVDAHNGASVTIPIDAAGQVRAYPVVDIAAQPSGVTDWTAILNSGHTTRLGVTPNGGLGRQGIAPTPDALLPLSLRQRVPSGTVSLTAKVSGHARLDAVLLQPEIARLTVGGTQGRTLIANAAGGFSVTHS